jgi:hypothetical protein
MIWTIIASFALTAIVGVMLIGYVLRTKDTPKGLAFIHGIFAVISLVLLIIYVSGDGPGPTASLTLFVIAATGGFILITRDIMRKTIPKWLAIAHGLIATTAFILLVIFALNNTR